MVLLQITHKILKFYHFMNQLTKAKMVQLIAQSF